MTSSHLPDRRLWRHTLTLLKTDCSASNDLGNTDDFGHLQDQEPRYMGRCRGRIQKLSGRDLELARSLHAQATHRVSMPYVPGFDSSWRIRLVDDTVLSVAGPALDTEAAREDMVFVAISDA